MEVIALAVVLGLIPSLGLAQADQDRLSCNASNDAPEAAVISACTRLIEAGTPGNDERAGFFHDRGNAHWRSGDYKAAVADESEAIAINPAFADAYMRRGAANFDDGNVDQSIAELRRKPSRSIRRIFAPTPTGVSPARRRAIGAVPSRTNPGRSRSTRDGSRPILPGKTAAITSATAPARHPILPARLESNRTAVSMDIDTGLWRSGERRTTATPLPTSITGSA